MSKKLIGLIFFVLTLAVVHGQVGNNDIAVYDKVSSFEMINITNHENEFVKIDDKALTLFVFLSTECPLCQNYSSTLRQVRADFKERVNLYAIIPGRSYSESDVAGFEKKYNTGFNLYIDKKQSLTNYLQATVTPQAILVNNKGFIVYTGAIDDWVQGLGKKKVKPQKHYLHDAIEQSLAFEKVKVPLTKAYGCKINDY